MNTEKKSSKNKNDFNVGRRAVQRKSSLKLKNLNLQISVTSSTIYNLDSILFFGGESYCFCRRFSDRALNNSKFTKHY